MKKIILLIFLFIGAKNFAQTNGITYQAVIFNPQGEQLPGVNNPNAFLVSKDICMLFKFVDEYSNVEYQEVIQTKTDEFGMVNLIIGSGSQTAGYASSFDEIVWNAVSKKLIVAVNTNGSCSSFIEISNQPFNSVPTAFFAKNAENVTGVVPIENGGTNAVTVVGAKTNLGLEQVNNTTDLDKPVSTDAQFELNLKENSSNKSISISSDQASDVKYPTVKSVKTYIDAATTSAASLLAAEITRATTAETVLTNTLTVEAVTARAAELANATAIAAEVTRAGIAEVANADGITAEAIARAAADEILTTGLDLKAPLASPTFTGTPLAPNPTLGSATTQIATTNFVTNAVATMSANANTNFVNLSSNQTIAGIKSFTSDANINGVTVGRGKFNENSNTVIGNRADVSFDGITNSVAIGANVIVTASNTIQLGSDGSGSYTAVTNVNTSAVITASGYKIASGTALQYLMANGSVSTGAAVVMEIADEFNLTESVVTFSLSQTPSPNSKVKMYVNGIRISNSAYSWTGTILTYIPSNNGSYSLSINDRIQFDYSY